MALDKNEILKIMTELAREAGKEILKHYTSAIAVEYKEDQSPVTEADRSANALIVQGLMGWYPDIPVLAEESADDPKRLASRLCFVVDPLDGTKEFIKRNGEFTVNIALVEEGRPILGVIYVPVLDEIYYGSKGLGAYSVIQGRTERLRVSERVGDIRLAKSRSYYAPEMDRLIEHNGIKQVLIAGSAYKGCLLARGDVEVYYRFGRTMEWDTAAMEIIALEAGGLFSGLNGNKFRYNKPNPENPTGFFIINREENRLDLSFLSSDAAER